MTKSSTQRTLEKLKKDNILCDKVEQSFNVHSKRRKDLFNIIDIIALDDGIKGIQACGADVQPHIKKITEEYKDNTIQWLSARGKLELWAWRKLKAKRGGKAFRWHCKVISFTLKSNKLQITP